MEFIHDPFQPDETIAAIATPPGDGAIGIIRIAGKEALTIAEKMFSGKKAVAAFKSHQLHFGTIQSDDGQMIDEVLLTVMQGKKSYSGETTVEIFCHGGSFITHKILHRAIELGARLAKPGEFTFKAFYNGKLDLAQAEAVQQLIGAKNDLALEAATQQLQGQLSKKVAQLQKELTAIAAILEAWVDFPEEGLEFASMEEIVADLQQTSLSLQQLIDTYRDGKKISEGISLCLIGCPNVGKSSLMNALLDKERAIVSNIAGTTRDIVEDQWRLKGIAIRLVDTAGIRQSNEVIEIEGIRRSKEALKKADLVLYVLDASLGLQADDAEIMALAPPLRTIAIWNKNDLPHSSLPKLPFKHVVSLSAKELHNLEALKAAIDEVIWTQGPPSKEELLITSERHFLALKSAEESLQKVILGLQQDVSPEFISFDMRESLKSLGKIIGTNISEDILSSIFSNFCIGK